LAACLQDLPGTLSHDPSRGIYAAHSGVINVQIHSIVRLAEVSAGGYDPCGAVPEDRACAHSDTRGRAG
jgi:hypothetical protein